MNKKYLIIAALFFAAGCLDVGTGENSTEMLGNKTLNYISENFLKPQGVEGELLGIDKYGENLYAVNLSLTKGAQSQNVTVFVTKDEKLILLGSGGGIIDLRREVQPEVEENVTPQHAARAAADIRDAAYAFGPENASVIIIDFNDFQCPFCKKFAEQTFYQLVKAYGDKIRYVFMDFPIVSIHPQAPKAHEAARCAGEQGKYLEYHDKLFARQGEWSKFSPNSQEESNELKKYAAELGMETAKFNTCLDSGKYTSAVNSNIQKGINAGVTGTPTFFINEQKIVGAQPFDVFKQVIDAQLKH